MEHKKYILLKNRYHTSRSSDGKLLFAIKALIDIPKYGVHAGDIGGFVESENNLSQDGSAWIAEYSYVDGAAMVYEDAFIGSLCEVKDCAKIHGSAKITNGSKISGCAEVFDNAVLSGVRVGENAKIYEDARGTWGDFRCGYNRMRLDVYGDAMIYGKAWFSANADIHENARIFGEACIEAGATVRGRASVCENAVIGDGGEVYDDALVCGNAKVYGHFETMDHLVWHSKVHGHAEVSGNAVVESGSEVYDRASVGGSAVITSKTTISGGVKICRGTHIRDYGGCGEAPFYWIAVFGEPNGIGLFKNTGGVCSNCGHRENEKGGYMPAECPECHETMLGIYDRRRTM